MEYRQTITSEELNSLPIKAFDKEIHLVDSMELADKASEYLKRQAVLGFDTETKPSFFKGQKNRVALLQLSTDEHAFLIRTCKIGLPKSVAEILADEKIIKAGVAIRDDIRALQKWRSFEPKGFVELATLAKDKYSIQNSGLKKLCGILLGFRISKAQQLSNWEDNVLRHSQKVYGATDAWAGLLVYRQLNEEKEENEE